jgi:enoyl-CoA hydratase/carnithine racemase
MAYEQILAETRGRVGIITLNRPERLNAYTAQMIQEATDQVETWNRDPGIGAFVITGAGRAFCAGADVGNFGRRLEADPDQEQIRFGAPWTLLMQRSKPSIAAVNGYAVGIGLTMILPCDMRIAAAGAKLSIRFIKMGLMPELGSTRLLAQHVGLGHATDMCLSGRMVDAEEAYHMGLVTAVTTKDDLLDTALARADELANNPTDAVMAIKEALRLNAMEPDISAVMEREGVRDRIMRKWPSHREAVTAFQEKREPHFNPTEGK